MKNADKKLLEGRTWRFFRAGGFDQVRIDSGDELLALDQLDQKLWVALSMPVQGTHFDKRTLSFIDTDGDNRIRAPELLAAIKWIGALIKNPDDLLGKSDMISISSINEKTAEGKSLVNALTKMLHASGKMILHQFPFKR